MAADRENGFYLAVDIGGTFTDIILAREDGKLYRRKVLSTFGELLDGIEAGLGEALADNGVTGPEIGKVVHASTVGTNTILEHKGAVTGLLTTEGFRDVLEIGRLRRPSLYDINWVKPRPLVRRRLRREVRERVSADGTVRVALELGDVIAALDVLHAEGVESVAVSLLHAHVNPVHEQRVREAILERYPNMLVSLSHEVLPELREYERTSTTVINAYILPAIDRYLGSFADVLERLAVDAPMYMMQSSGGISTVATARKRPVTIVESGPAAGALATAFMATHTGIENCIAFDMGGTTAKACVVQNGAPEMTFEYEVGAGANTASPLLRGGGYALRGPTISIAEVGSGGGSIAWIDEGSALQVGPESAGANPGPACYGRGGTRATVTDANVVLGYVDPESIAGGRLKIDRHRAARAIETQLADVVGLSVEDAAFGIHVIANENMARAVRAVTTERGRDPREFSLIAFGGSGPVHAAGLARSIGIGKVIVPLAAGLFSALGLLFSDIRSDFVSSVMMRLDRLDDDTLRARFDNLLDRARERGSAEGMGETTAIRWLADVRYLGQSFELSVELDPRDGALVDRLRRGFESEYVRLYGRLGIGAVEVVSIRVAVVAPVKSVPYHDLALDAKDTTPIHPSVRRLYFGAERGSFDASIFKGRGALPAGGVEGPAIIEEPDTTIVVPPESRALLDGASNVVIELR